MNILLSKKLYIVNYPAGQISTLFLYFNTLRYQKECSQYSAEFVVDGRYKAQNPTDITILQDLDFPEIKLDLKRYKNNIREFSTTQNKLNSLCQILFFTRANQQTTALLKFILNIYLVDLRTLRRNKQKNLDYAQQTREQSIQNFVYQLNEEISSRSQDVEATQNIINYVVEKIDELEDD
jgi:exo-beta-1,3-glucanase (GH17 family)